MFRASNGMTLTELIVALSILALVVSTAGAVLFSAFQSYTINATLQEDVYNARLAMLTLSREVHRGVGAVWIDDDAHHLGSSVLTLQMDDAKNTEIVYRIEDGYLIRIIDAAGEPSPVHFVPVKLERFTAENDDGRFLRLDLVYSDSLTLQTTLAINRMYADTPTAQ